MHRLTITVLHRVGVILASALIILCSWSCQKAGVDRKTPHQRWKLTVIMYEEMHQTEDAEKGFRQGLADTGLREGTDFEIVSRNAQGDIATVRMMLDAVAVDGTDMLIALQTPKLHTAVTRNAGLPLVFMVVANPYVISSVGSNDSTHLHYVTGVYTNTTFDMMFG